MSENGRAAGEGESVLHGDKVGPRIHCFISGFGYCSG